jgi:sugar lactone lactonase YvrE
MFTKRNFFHVLAVCGATAATLISANSALATTNNAYRAQFNGESTAGFEITKGFYPNALALSPAGDVYVNDAENGVIDEFNASGSKVEAELKGKANVETGEPEEIHSEGIAANASGDLFAGEGGHKLVYEFASDGELLRDGRQNERKLVLTDGGRGERRRGPVCGRLRT